MQVQTLKPGAILPSSSAPGAPLLLEAPENKKPGVERRVQSRFGIDSPRDARFLSTLCS